MLLLCLPCVLFNLLGAQLTWRSTSVVRNFGDVQRGLSFLLYHFVVFFSLLVVQI
jgi:hypothetical protein